MPEEERSLEEKLCPIGMYAGTVEESPHAAPMEDASGFKPSFIGVDVAVDVEEERVPRINFCAICSPSSVKENLVLNNQPIKLLAVVTATKAVVLLLFLLALTECRQLTLEAGSSYAPVPC